MRLDWFVCLYVCLCQQGSSKVLWTDRKFFSGWLAFGIRKTRLNLGSRPNSNNSFIHSYSFNVQVDITQLQTDRETKKKTELFIYVAVSSY